mmetsp:Transcript_81987/g.265726  ORF Transcript_81987/g.265726 Transcript_81987/m.265726 type:complete len:275 (+) Transcript_81987:447-1271(+)
MLAGAAVELEERQHWPLHGAPADCGWLPLDRLETLTHDKDGAGPAATHEGNEALSLGAVCELEPNLVPGLGLCKALSHLLPCAASLAQRDGAATASHALGCRHGHASWRGHLWLTPAPERICRGRGEKLLAGAVSLAALHAPPLHNLSAGRGFEVRQQHASVLLRQLCHRVQQCSLTADDNRRGRNTVRHQPQAQQHGLGAAAQHRQVLLEGRQPNNLLKLLPTLQVPGRAANVCQQRMAEEQDDPVKRRHYVLPGALLQAPTAACAACDRGAI